MTALGPILVPNTVNLAEHYGLDITYIALLTGYFLLGVGVAGILFVASARTWGKRHLFLLGTFLLIFSSAWAGASSASYTSILWARIIQGAGTAPFEALVNATVGDLYFVHVSIHTLPLSLLDRPSLLTCNLLGARQAHGFGKPSGFWGCLLHSYPHQQNHKYG